MSLWCRDLLCLGALGTALTAAFIVEETWNFSLLFLSILEVLEVFDKSFVLSERIVLYV